MPEVKKLDDIVSDSFSSRIYDKIKKAVSGLTDYISPKIGSRLGLALLAGALYFNAPKQAEAAPEWSVDLISVTNVAGTNIFTYKVTNKSAADNIYDLTSLTIGAGTNEINSIVQAKGYYQSNFSKLWTVDSSDTNINLSYSPNGFPIYASGNTNDDWGTFIIKSTETETGPITFDAESSAAGEFPTKYVLGPVKNYNLVVTSSHGTPTPSGTTKKYHGEIINASVDDLVTNAVERYECKGWTGSGNVPSTGNTNQVTFTINQDSSVTWNWDAFYKLDLATNGNGNADGSGWYASGTNKTITATPDQDHYFKGWTGDIPTNKTPLEVIMDSPKSLTATFKPKPGIGNITPGNSFTLNFEDLDIGQDYTVQESTNLLNPNAWTDVTNFTAYSGTTNITVNTENDNGYYRLIFQP